MQSKFCRPNLFQSRGIIRKRIETSSEPQYGSMLRNLYANHNRNSPPLLSCLVPDCTSLCVCMHSVENVRMPCWFLTRTTSANCPTSANIKVDRSRSRPGNGSSDTLTYDTVNEQSDRDKSRSDSPRENENKCPRLHLATCIMEESSLRAWSVGLRAHLTGEEGTCQLCPGILDWHRTKSDLTGSSMVTSLAILVC